MNQSPSTFSAALRGVGFTPATPFTPGLDDVDEAGVRANTRFMVEAGATLLYACGNTGEFTSLSLDEWERVTAATIDAAAGEAAVAPGVGHGIGIALEMVARGGDLGADGVLCMPPPPVYLSDAGLVRYYTQLADASPVPLVVYRRNGRPGEEALLEVAAHPNLAGVKWGDDDVHTFSRAAARSDDVVWTCGIAERWAPFFHLAGSEGFTTGLGNFAPRLPLQMQAALAAGDLEEAMRLRALAVPFEDLRARHGSAENVPAVKAAMDLAGLAGGGVRPPLRDVDAATRTEIEALVGALAGVPA